MLFHERLPLQVT